MAADQDIAEKFLSKLQGSPFVMIGLEGGGHSEPLTAQLDEAQPDALFFFTANDNRLAVGGPAMAQFASKGHDFFACLAGTVSVDTDPAQIDKLFNSHVEAWFPGGRNDPSLTLLRFDVSSAELWETDISLAGRVKMLFGGKIEGKDEGSHAVVGALG